ncbi:hypothetical protein SVEN_2105 [Streptomyces venezuelae ATCC 10712]|uniref:Uncharacterized protein n=1 Tax=Streptomyces venezuelae (strain ATCC 10712 / CBS 650.69 / DSM 40230 / JCM 4526 / NBRC 13096 / PD 04745) TaxID=953739 RepID=F2RL02_STRVP|nr:hypothetical protein SVEN_2105 [Streptomyces venezuelae ATCC 10712]
MRLGGDQSPLPGHTDRCWPAIASFHPGDVQSAVRLGESSGDLLAGCSEPLGHNGEGGAVGGCGEDFGLAAGQRLSCGSTHHRLLMTLTTRRWGIWGRVQGRPWSVGTDRAQRRGWRWVPALASASCSQPSGQRGGCSTITAVLPELGGARRG